MPTTVEVFVPLSDLQSSSPAGGKVAPLKPAPVTVASHDSGDSNPEQALYTLALHRAAKLSGMPLSQIGGGRFLRKSLDARKGFPLGFRLQVEVFGKGEPPGPAFAQFACAALPPSAAVFAQPARGGGLTAVHGGLGLLQGPGPLPEGAQQWSVLHGCGFGRLPPPRAVPAAVAAQRHVIVVGSGPAGTFAALRLSQAGVRVTLVEQGQAVQPRRRDLAQLTRGHFVPDSNYCFGEGGAGTFSDGKLYTRSKDRPAIGETLALLIEHGADPEIGVESRAHIGSNRLPKILTGMREALQARGVTYRFGCKVIDLLKSPSGQLRGVRCAVLPSGVSAGSADAAAHADYEDILGQDVVLAVGHSARSVYELMLAHQVELCAKPFAIGARIEHPQPLINRIQYGRAADHPALPPAFYHVAAQSQGRGVYSFCMCPGGWVVPSSTEADGLCVNGMSLKRRDSPLANSALVVSVETADFAPYARFPGDPLAGMFLQRAVEQAAFAAGGGDYVAPATQLSDFLAGRPSAQVQSSTYRPRIIPGDLSAILPGFVGAALREACRSFARTLPGFLSTSAQLVGVETRTSAPVRIVRDASLQSPSLPGLYPSGEGAGYAGGIVSAAIDGLRIADAILAKL